VVQQIKHIGRDPGLVRETVRQLGEVRRELVKSLKAELKRLKRDRGRVQQKINTLIDSLTTGRSISQRLAELEGRIDKLDGRIREVKTELDALDQSSVNHEDVAQALSLFDPVWSVLWPQERERIIRLLIERVEYDGRTGEITIEFKPTGIRSLAGEIDEAEAATG